MMRNTSGFRSAALALFVALPALLGAPHALAAGAPVTSATAAQKKSAGAHFAAGMKASKAGNQEQALSEFQASYNTVASPNSHLMIARTLTSLGRLGQAYTQYEQTVREAEAAAKTDFKYEQTAKAAANERDALRARIAFVTVQVSGAGPNDELLVGQRTIERSAWDKPVPVNPGSVQVELRSPSGAAQTRMVKAQAGGTVSVQLSKTKPAAPAPKPKVVHAVVAPVSGNPLRPWAYVAGGVGAAGLITFTVFGLLDNSKYSDLQSACPKDSCSADRKSDADTGRTYQTIANVGLGVGVVGVVGGAVLFFLSGKHERGSAQRMPRVEVGPSSVRVTGTF